ncbi:Rieske (2Fe-2S) protein [Pseudomonas sp. LPB0260]|uniref:Rieske (2Fe-2S) protein n=1 Tax=Pseudomonas sp. LPB0260 TaxID=2614442 RepID=UPI0015C235BE|nr:Rieske (2Fe-2S) protein [Pseudomonas sp. LPB0260]QLC72554.1 Rieske (2Fe-2S) protein [Pseudomonas sp. LPB0260]QLC75329.1 Rieske (2Fe-2S) protein [Pseudomonas sp. LPB0260]
MFVALERLLNLEEGYRRTFQVQGRELLLLVVEGRRLLLENSCPHRGAPLHTAAVNGRVLRCARHGIEFDLSSGRALNASCGNLVQLPLSYDGDRVGIDL